LAIDLSKDAVFLGVEPLIFGRVAMGERLTEAAFANNITFKQDGALIFAEAVRRSGDLSQSLAGAATVTARRRWLTSFLPPPMPKHT